MTETKAKLDVDDVRALHKDQEAIQAECTHHHPYVEGERTLRSALGGQRDHLGNYHFLCLWCMKSWIQPTERRDYAVPHLEAMQTDVRGGTSRLHTTTWRDRLRDWWWKVRNL